MLSASCHGRQLDISQNLHLPDAAQVLHPVLEVQQVNSVNSNPELMGLTQNYDLHRQNKTTMTTAQTHKSGVNSTSYLKILSSGKGEGVQLGLLWTPALEKERISHQHLLLHTRIEVKSDVAASRPSQVDAKTTTRPTMSTHAGQW